MQYGPILAAMEGREADWRRKYRRYVETGLARTDEEFEAVWRASPRSIGDEGFRAQIEDLHRQFAGKHPRREDVAFRSVVEPLSADTVLSLAAYRQSSRLPACCSPQTSLPVVLKWQPLRQ